VLATRLATGWLDRRFLPHTRLDAGARYSVITVVGYGGLALTVIVALGQLGVNPQSLTVIAGALSVGIGFGLQSIVSNFVSGLIVLAERPVRVGDLVTVKGEEGRVKKISVRSTLIATGDRTDLVVPNTDLITSIVRNKTLTDDTQRLRVPLILDKETDIEVLHEILIKVAERHPNVAENPAPTALLMRIGEHGLEYEVRCFLVDLAASDTTRSELNSVWLTLFRRAGIRLGGPPAA
jgi:potassium-dependent mechanosensitive channel